jgi:hypothetical protein
VPVEGGSIEQRRSFFFNDFDYLDGWRSVRLPPEPAAGLARASLARHRDIDVTIVGGSMSARAFRHRARERDRYLRYGVGMRLGLVIVALLASGCAMAEDAAGGATDDFIDMDTPPGNCSAGTGADPCPDPGTTGVPEGGACQQSSQCAPGSACIAPFIEGEIGEFECTSQCITVGDETAWCLDSSACCDEGAVCSARGLCIEGALDESGTASDGTASDGTASDGTASDGTASSSGGSTSGTGGSGSETGGSTTMGAR